MMIIYLEDENGNKEEKIIDKLMIIPKVINNFELSKTCCWKYIDLYGDTVFNRKQCEDLIKESKEIISVLSSSEKKLFEEIVQLFEKAASEYHYYIRFFGD